MKTPPESRLHKQPGMAMKQRNEAALTVITDCCAGKAEVFEFKGFNKVKLDWEKRDAGEHRDFDAGCNYEYAASIPFELEYVIRFDDGPYEMEMGQAYGIAEALGEDGVSHEQWQQIRKKHGEPSETDEKWSVSIEAQLGAGCDFVFEIESALTVEQAKKVALDNYLLRVAAAVDGWPLY